MSGPFDRDAVPPQRSLFKRHLLCIFASTIAFSVVALLAVVVIAIVVSTRSLPLVTEIFGQREPNTAILIIGGIDEKGNVVDSMQLYDPFSPSKNRLLDANLRTPRRNHVTAVIGRKIIVAGGMDEHGFMLRSTEIFEPEKGKWVSGPDMVERKENAAGAVIGQLLYLCGGVDLTYAESNSCQFFDLEKFTWQSGAEMHAPYLPIAAAVQNGSSDFFVAGYSFGSQKQTVIEKFVSKKGEFEEISHEGPIGRNSLAMVILEEFLFMCGFSVSEPRVFCSRFGLKSREWHRPAQMNIARAHFAFVTFGERIFALGGQAAGVKTDSVESYDLFSQEWKREARLARPVSQTGAVVY